jgi:uncharacterized protein YbjT (DUF2867 family)
MILVTGATGTIGGRVLRLLAEKRVPARAMSRNPDRLPTGDFEAVNGDYEDPASLRAAVVGVDAVFLLSAPGANIADHDLAMLEAAAGSQVSKVVKISAIHTGDPGYETTSGWHLPGEQALHASGLAWTILRPSAFMSNAVMWADDIRAGRPVPSRYGDGANGVVDPRDVAEVAVEALLSSKHDKQIYTLTGPEAISVPEQVAQIGEVLGVSAKSMDVPLEQTRADFLAQGLDAASVEGILAGFDIVRRGGNADVTDHVQRVLGRPPRTFRTWVEEHRAVFR